MATLVPSMCTVEMDQSLYEREKQWTMILGLIFYNFTVECVDLENPGNNDSVFVNITILPVNEYFPILNMTTISVNVSETLEVGTSIVSTVRPSLNVFSAIDGDRGEHGRLRYSLSRLTQDSNPIILPFLDLDSTTGTLVVTQSLDIDSRLPLTVTDFTLDVIQITVCDREGDGDNADKCPNLVVQFHVDSVNEFDPEFSQKVYHATIPESGWKWEQILLKSVVQIKALVGDDFNGQDYLKITSNQAMFPLLWKTITFTRYILWILNQHSFTTSL